jgi:hypothetical protein
MAVSPASSSTPHEALLVSEANAMGDRGELDEPTPGGYAYGPPPTLVRDSNYISDENLLVWLAQKQDGLYGELRDHMDMSRARSKLMADLSNLKTELDAGIEPEEAKAEIETLLASYAGTEFEAELTELFAGPLAQYAGTEPEAETAEVFGVSVGLENPMGMQDTEALVREHVTLPALTEQLSSSIQNKIDQLGRDDQLELIQIQSLTADIREASQLASNLVASANQASNTIVGNIGR